MSAIRRRNKEEFTQIEVTKDTRKLLILYKAQNELYSYEEAIKKLLSCVKNKKLVDYEKKEKGI